jgi:putative endonuclease
LKEEITITVILLFKYGLISLLIMLYYVYILYSESRDRYYIGSCANVEERLARHNGGSTPSTKPGRPWKIVYTEAHTSKTEALKRENYLKRMKSRLLLEELIHSKETR